MHRTRQVRGSKRRRDSTVCSPEEPDEASQVSGHASGEVMSVLIWLVQVVPTVTESSHPGASASGELPAPGADITVTPGSNEDQVMDKTLLARVPEVLPEPEFVEDELFSEGHETARPIRANRRLPKRFRDLLPGPLLPPPPPVSVPGPLRVTLHVWERVQTCPNEFGLFRKFLGCPSYDPDSALDMVELMTPRRMESIELGSEPLPGSPFHPFPNFTQYALSNNYLNAPLGQRSRADFDRLLEVISDPRFNPQDVRGFRLWHMQQRLNAFDMTSNVGPLDSGDRWECNVPVTIYVPEGKRWWTSPQGRPFEIQGLCHRSIIAIVRHVYMTQNNVHYTPYELFYQPSKHMPPMQCWGDI